MRTFGCYLVICAGLLSAVACDDPTKPSSTVRSITVSGRDLYPGFVDSTQFTASATLSDGTSRDVTTQSTWTSSNNSIATVSGSGEVRAATFGSATITARYQGVSGSQDLAVRCGVALSILPSGPLQIARGSTVRLQTFGNFVTPLFQQVDGTFSSSRAEIASVARVPQTNDWQLTALAPGQATIHATYQCGAADLEVTVF